MNKRQRPTAGRFLWTGLMILIPVIALGAVGLWQLRQDRVAALAEAQAGVENGLEEALAIGKALPVLEVGEIELIFSPDGELIWPVLTPRVPNPNPVQNPHAETFQQIMSDRYLTSSEQAHALHELASQEDCGTSAAGFSIRQLALRNALRFGKKGQLEAAQLSEWALALMVDVINHPSILSEKFLSEAKEFTPSASSSSIIYWNQELDRLARVQSARDFYQENSAQVRQFITQKDGFTLSKWLGSESENFCRLRREPERMILQVFSREFLQEQARAGFKQISLPRHLGLRLWLDKRLVKGEARADVLSMLSDTRSGVLVEVVFTDHDAFFQPVRQRSLRTAGLIALAILAAGVGWFAAWRAFLRQQQLATMKDNFVSAVSHELKAPIASIGLMAEELGTGSNNRADYTRLIAGECARLGSLVENVLDYARIESGHDRLNFEEADLGALVRAAADLMKPAAAERGIGIEVKAPPADELCASIDVRSLGRVLVNLLDNAIKYAPPNTTITVTAEGEQMTVSDQGDPIPAAERERIFERFYRSGSELTRQTKGVGIGLSLVHHIALAHDGKIWVESDQSGNHFIFQIGKEHFNLLTPDA